MDTTYYVIYGLLMVLSVFGLIVGVSNDACNFLNSSLGCRAGSFNTVVAVAAVGVLLGASFSSGMMEVARSGVFLPTSFNFHEVMLLFLAVMIANVILLDIFNTLGLPTSTTIALVFALLGSALGMAVYSCGNNPGNNISDYINSGNAFRIVTGIFASVAIAFTVGTTVMWLARLLFSFHYKRTFRYIGSFWCGLAFTAITYFAVFKGLKGSAIMPKELMAYIDTHMLLVLPCCFIGWSIIAAFLQYICHVNTLRLTVLAGTGALALAFAGNDLVNFIGVFMAAKSAMGIANEAVAAGATPEAVSGLSMEGLAKPQTAELIYLIGAGLIMVGALFFSKKARKVTETELKLSAATTSKERFGSSPPARVMVRYTLNTIRFIKKITPTPVAEFVGKRFTQLTPEEESGALYDQIRGSVNLTVAALLKIGRAHV